MADEIKNPAAGAPAGDPAPGAGDPAGGGDPAAAAAAAAAASKSAGGGDPAGDPVATPSDWPADWQERMADGDADLLKELKRRTTPKDVAKSLLEAKKKISSGEYKKVIPAPDATKDPEGFAAWRKENGIPEAPDKYDLTLSDGLVIGDDDKPYVDQFLSGAHERNFTQQQATDALNIYFKMQEDNKARLIEFDNGNKTAAEDQMRADWGAEYRANHTEVSNFLKNRFADEGGASLLEARLPDGKRIGDNPEFMNRFLEMSREINPAASLVPNSNNPLATMQTEMDGFKQQMKDDPKGWSKNVKGQERYMQLIQGMERMKK